MDRFDVAVVGLGGIGSAAAWYAASSGASVIGLERFELGGHHRGASHDHSRIIRHSYNTAHYVTLTFGAYDAWRDVERASDERCVHTTGGLDLFPAGAAIDIDTYRSAMGAANVDFDELGATDVMRRWPGFRLAADVTALHQSATGLVSPAHTVAVLQRLATERGAVLRGATAVTALEQCGEQRVRVRLGDGTTVEAGHVIVAADAWTKPLIDPLLDHPLPLTVTKEQVTYYDVVDPASFAIGSWPVWIWMDDPSFYGFPTFAKPGIKVSQDCGGHAVDPDMRSFDPDPAILGRTDTFVADTFGNSVGGAHTTTTCLYTLTPDRDFVLDAVPGTDIIVALGSAHAYKFAAWFGRTAAALTRGDRTNADLAPFSLQRPALTDPMFVANWLV